MLQQHHRLPGAIRLISPRSFNTTLFFLKVGKNDIQQSRFGFVVRKTVDKRATTRNRVRRVFRSCVEEMLEEIKPGYDMLFLLKGHILEMKREELYNELHAFFKEQQFLQ